jgi:hypothetical protein
MASRRYVKQNAAGGWDVLRAGDRRAAVQAASKRTAVARAQALVQGEGGGEVQVVNRMGKIVTSKAVPARSAKKAIASTSPRRVAH